MAKIVMKDGKIQNYVILLALVGTLVYLVFLR